MKKGVITITPFKSYAIFYCVRIKTIYLSFADIFNAHFFIGLFTFI